MSPYQTTLPPSAAPTSGSPAGFLGCLTSQTECAQASPPSEIREIALYIERLRVAIGSVEHSVDALEARMEPVLSPPAPCAPIKGEERQPVTTKLGQVLAEFESRVRTQANRVGDINQRTLL